MTVDEQPQIAGQFDVSGIPTGIVFKNGSKANRVVGYRPRKDIMTVRDETI